jgi:hypothetical protein
MGMKRKRCACGKVIKKSERWCGREDCPATHWEACPGEAHRNEAGYDHCMVCLPGWGKIRRNNVEEAA